MLFSCFMYALISIVQHILKVLHMRMYVSNIFERMNFVGLFFVVFCVGLSYIFYWLTGNFTQISQVPSLPNPPRSVFQPRDLFHAKKQGKEYQVWCSLPTYSPGHGQSPVTSPLKKPESSPTTASIEVVKGKELHFSTLVFILKSSHLWLSV